MAISRQQLFTALSNWCVQFCYEGCPPNQRMMLLNQFCNSALVPQEDDIPASAATYFENNHFNAYVSLKGQLEAIGFRTDTSNPADKAHNQTECAGWAANRQHHVEEVHGMLYDLEHWQAGYRGSKAVLNTLKVVRMLSR
jgi:hypothetical protein